MLNFFFFSNLNNYIYIYIYYIAGEIGVRKKEQVEDKEEDAFLLLIFL